jgi:tetratricopeptide (TPR) repeat protein
MIKIFSNRKIVIAILIAAVFIIFSNSLSSEFVWDDKFILKKDVFTDWNNLGPIFLMADTAIADDNISYYRPLTYLTFLFDYQMWGLKPFWYNLENVLLHALIVLLLYLMIFEISGDNVLAFLSSLLFAVHPAVTEPVNFISGGRNTMLCAALSLCSLLLLLYSRGGKRKYAVFSVVVFFFALLSKEQAIVIPVFLLLTTVLSGSKELKVNKYLLISFFVASVVYLVIRTKILGSVTSEFDVNMSYEKLGLIAYCLSGYFRIMLFPLNLNIEYVTLPLQLLSFKSIIAAGGMIALICLSIRKNTPEILRMSCIWLVLGFLPISNIIPIPSAAVADRYIYIPLLGMCLAAGYIVKYFYEKKQAAVIVVFPLCIILFGTLTYARNNAWSTEENLWMDVVKKSPEKAAGYYNLGITYQKKGFTDKAVQQYQFALQKDPDYVPAQINIGIVYHSQGHADKAMRKFQRAIELKPDLAKGYYNLALVFHSLGQLDKAIEQYEKAITLKPGYAQAYNNMGTAHRAKEKIDEAITAYRAAIKFDPKSSNAHNNLGSAYQSKGMIDKAVAEYRIAVELDPGHKKAVSNLRVANMIKDYLKKEKKPGR